MKSVSRVSNPPIRDVQGRGDSQQTAGMGDMLVDIGQPPSAASLVRVQRAQGQTRWL